MRWPEFHPGWQSRLRLILNTVWDPIGLAEDCPADEYDRYNHDITGALSGNAPPNDGDLATYLLWAETEYIGLSQNTRATDNERRARTVRSIRDLGPPA